MSHGETRGSGGRSGSRGHGNRGGPQKSETPDRSSGNRGRGFQRRGRGYGNASDGFMYVKKSSPVADLGNEVKGVQQQRISVEDEIGGTNRQPVVKKLEDGKGLLPSTASSSLENMNLTGECEGKDVVKDGDRMHSDLVDRVKHVSLLSCKESVSCTSDQNVELSRVEDHKSSNESNKRPTFDIVLEKKGFGLKPSYLAVNREKRKAVKGYTGIVIRPGMLLLKNYLSLNDQVMIVNKCRQLGLAEGGFYQPGYKDGADLHLKMMCLGKNWDPETSRYGQTRPIDGSTPPKIPLEFHQLVDKAITESQSLIAKNSKKVNGEDGVPFMSPDICIVNFYTTTGRLGLHQDKDESRNSIQNGLPVVSFSIGDSAEFLYGDIRDEEKAEKVMLESGDVLIFGGQSRNIFHGVRSIQKETAPKVLAQETSLRPGRLNLTFRQY